MYKTKGRKTAYKTNSRPKPPIKLITKKYKITKTRAEKRYSKLSELTPTAAATIVVKSPDLNPWSKNRPWSPILEWRGSSNMESLRTPKKCSHRSKIGKSEGGSGRWVEGVRRGKGRGCESAARGEAWGQATAPFSLSHTLSRSLLSLLSCRW